MLLDREQSLLLVVDVQEKLVPLIYQHQRLVQHCDWLMQVAKLLQVPVLISEQYPKGLGHTLPLLLKDFRDASVVTKTHFSCADDAQCLATINQTKKNQVVLIGIEAHVCVLQTAYGLRREGKEVFVVADAIASRRLQDKKLAIKRMRDDQIHIVSREMVVFEWLHRSDSEIFKTISKQFLR